MKKGGKGGMGGGEEVEVGRKAKVSRKGAGR